jgi:hypothetical protein
MPKAIEDKLKREAEKKFPEDMERQNAYVYGTMQKIEENKKQHPYFRKLGRIRAE